MRERIYTVPLSEVIVAGQGCPFCLLAAKAEKALLRVYLDGMLVDIDWRGRVLREWLCARHLAGMQTETRKLGGAIITQALLAAALEALVKQEAGGSLPDWGGSCVACRDLTETLTRHAEAFVHTWVSEPDFRAMVSRADPFCLPHLALVIGQAGRLPRRSRAEVRAGLLRMEEEALRPLLAKVDWFVKKFDARFRDEPWDGAEDAVLRAVEVLAGRRGEGE